MGFHNSDGRAGERRAVGLRLLFDLTVACRRRFLMEKILRNTKPVNLNHADDGLAGRRYGTFFRPPRMAGEIIRYGKTAESKRMVSCAGQPHRRPAPAVGGILMGGGFRKMNPVLYGRTPAHPGSTTDRQA